MAAPNLAKVIGVKVQGATVGEFVIVRNLTRGGQLTKKLGGSGNNISTVFNPAPDLQWQDKDLIQAEIRGRVTGVVQKRIKSGGAQIEFTAVADTSTSGVNL